ncbi:hypothetical protein JKP88DRAFT_222426 [Tribonema minus]|uniref:Uncharacterized protein n=1 Tax=Tribonema minus TaxID=303371 RepID=A0A836CDD1_9STRA|nr:hypothetical protein JKP88DRAFT_222426 [Tribonema minus]
MQRRSALLFIGSVGGASQSVFPGFRHADAMSKAAVGHMVKLLAAEHCHSPIDFVCVSPGAVRTDMFKASTLDKMTDAERQAFIARLPKGRLIEPEEIAEAVYWLATAQCARIFNGACLDASQGLAVRPGLITERP